MSCIIESCNNPKKTGKYCQKHYMRLFRHGDPNYIGRINRNRPKICIIDGCNKPHFSYGYCNKHACTFRYRGDPTAKPIKNRNHGEICEKSGCTKPWYCKGLCKFHYNNLPIMRQRERLRAKQYAKEHPENGLGCSSRAMNKVFKLIGNDYCALKTIWDYCRGLKQWSASVRKRDNHTCQICGIRDVKLFAHHLFHKAKYPKLSLNLNNGITLCKKCHNEVHGKRLVN